MISYKKSNSKCSGELYPDLSKRYWIGFNPAYAGRLFKQLGEPLGFHDQDVLATCDNEEEIPEAIKFAFTITPNEMKVWDTLKEKEIKGGKMSCSNDLSGSMKSIINFLVIILEILATAGLVFIFLKLARMI